MNHELAMKYRVFFDRKTLDKQLSVNGASLEEYLKTIELPSDGKTRLLKVDLPGSNPQKIDMSDAYAILSINATPEFELRDHQLYSPVFSFGFMDRGGMVYPSHFDITLAHGMVEWSAPKGKGEVDLSLNRLMCGPLQQALDCWVDTETGKILGQQYWENNILGCTLSGTWVTVNDKGVTNPIILIRAYVIVDKLEPVIYDKNMEIAGKQEDPEAFIREKTVYPVTPDEFERIYAERFKIQHSHLLDLMSRWVSALTTAQTFTEIRRSVLGDPEELDSTGEEHE